MASNDSPSIRFSGVLTILMTLATLVFSEPTTNPTARWGKAFFFIGLYFILALSQTPILKKIAELMTQILTINKDADLSGTQEKVLLMRNQLELYSDMFSRKFTEVREYTKAAEKWHNKMEQIRTGIGNIISGSITRGETVWILFYISYQILIATNYIVIALPFNMIASVVFITGLQLTTPNIKSMGGLLKDIFRFANTEPKDNNYDFSLSNIIHSIRLICFSFNRISRYIERITGKTVMEFLMCGYTRCPYITKLDQSTT